MAQQVLKQLDAKGVAEFHVKAQKTIMEAVLLWSSLEEPGLHPDVPAGIMLLGDGFFAAAELLLDETAKSTPTHAEFKETWKAAYTDMVKVEDEVGMHVREYAMRAEPQSLQLVVRLCTNIAIDLVKRFLPEELIKPVTSFLGGIDDIMEGVVEGWTDATRGDSAAAMEDIVVGVREASDAVLTDEAKTRASYEVIFGAVGEQIVRLNRHVLAYTRKLQEMLVCQRDLHFREKRPPIMSLLQTGDVHHELSGDLEKGRESLDVTLEKKKGKKEQESHPVEPLKPSCDANSEFEELIDGSCYTACKPGFVVMVTQRDSCLSACPANMPEALPSAIGVEGAVDGIMCGASLRILELVREEVVSQSKREEEDEDATEPLAKESKPGELDNSLLEGMLAGVRSSFEVRQSTAFNFAECVTL